MRPFTALPPKVLASMLGVVGLVAAFFIALPRWGVALGLVAAGLTVVGAALVAFEARLRRRGQRPEPLSPPLRTSVRVWAIGAAVLSFLCAPDLTVKDAGEIGSAIHVLGVPHPTGFPLFCMVGKALSLLPIGHVVFRLTLLSVVTMAGAAALATALAIQAQGRAAVGAGVTVVALLAAAGPWLHATTIEVYAFSTLGLAITVLCATLGVLRHDVRFLVLAAFLLGLGTGGHVTWPLQGAAFLALCLIVVTRRQGFRLLAVFLFAFGLGTTVLAYLPVAASRDPVLNWGNPSTWSAFIAHLTGERIRQSFADEYLGLNLPVLAVRARLLAKVLWESCAFVLPLAAAGAAILLRSFTPVALGLFAIVACDLAFALLANPMGILDLQTSTHTFWVLAVLAGVGSSWLWGRADTSVLRVVVAIVVALALAAQLALSPVDRDLRHISVPRRVVSALLDNAPPLSSVLTTSDDLSAALVAVQAIENARPDVLVLIRPHLADNHAVSRRIRASRLVPADDELLHLAASANLPNEVGAIEAALWPALARRGPIFVEIGDSAADRAIRANLRPAFPAYIWTSEAPARQSVLSSADEAMSRALALRHSADRWGRAFLGSFVRLLGAHLSLVGLDADAIRVTESALALNPGDARTWHNLGVLHRASLDLSRGVACLEEAVRLDPGYLRAWQSLAKTADLAGRPDLARKAGDRVRALKGLRDESSPSRP